MNTGCVVLTSVLALSASETVAVAVIRCDAEDGGHITFAQCCIRRRERPRQLMVMVEASDNLARTFENLLC